MLGHTPLWVPHGCTTCSCNCSKRMIVALLMLLYVVQHPLPPTCVSVANPAAAAADAWPVTTDPGSGIALICTVALEELLESHQMPPIAAMITVTADMGRSANDSAITTTLASTPSMLLLLSEAPASFKITVAPGVTAFAAPICTPILEGRCCPCTLVAAPLPQCDR